MALTITRIQPGNAGIVETVHAMWRQILTYRPEVRDTAAGILRARHVQRASDFLKAVALYDWVQTHLAYTGDHLLIEEIRGPQWLLDEIAVHGDALADCDDYVILLGALLATIGIPFRLIVTSARPDREFDHIFLVVETSIGMIPADAITGQRFGWSIPIAQITNRMEFPLPLTLEEIDVDPMQAMAY